MPFLLIDKPVGPTSHQVVGMVLLLISIALPVIRPAAVVLFLLSALANYISAILHHWPTSDPHLFKTKY